jgi:pyruvate dehydrogenase E1 component alpha subunit
MHLADVSVGAYGCFAIVGAHLPIATGFGVAAKYQGTDDVCLCIFGDGATNTGAFHEALNLAAILALPVIFLCENNLYGEYSPLSSTTPIDDLSRRAAAYAIRGERVDGNDVEAVHAIVAAAVARARERGGPTMIEALTYRHSGHSRTDPATYRPKEEVEAWLARDPIVALERRLSADGLDDSTIQEIRDAAADTIAEHRDRALSWPEPAADSRLEHVYA